MKITLYNEVDEEEIIQSISESCTHQEVVEFIKKLDAACQDWGVTEELHLYFEQEYKKLMEFEKNETANDS